MAKRPKIAKSTKKLPLDAHKTNPSSHKPEISLNPPTPSETSLQYDLQRLGILKNLTSLAQWVGWKHVQRKGKYTKIPCNPHTGKFASVANPSTWDTFSKACEGITLFGFEGIGFVFTEHDNFVGIDLDHCRNAETGELETWAQHIVTAINSYTEISPSREGIHIIAQGSIPQVSKRKGQVEIYSQSRYFTMTGNSLLNTPSSVEERQTELTTFCNNYLGKGTNSTLTVENLSSPQPTPQTKPLPLSDEEIIREITTESYGNKYQKLWAGNYQEYPSQSEGDLALCNLLARLTQHKPTRMDELFRKSGLMREKWDEPHQQDGKTYGEITLAKAINLRPQELTLQTMDQIVERATKASKEEIFESSILVDAANLYLKNPAKYGFLKVCVKQKLGSTRDWERAVKTEVRKNKRLSLDTKRSNSFLDDECEGWVSADQNYLVTQGCFFRRRDTQEGPQDIQISNFIARIIRETIYDDGAEESRSFEIEGKLAVENTSMTLPKITIPSLKFDGLTWIPQSWGGKPTKLPNETSYLPYAIRQLSGQIPQQTIYRHLGWRQVNNEWIYCHAGGAIGAPDILVDVSKERFERYTLPSSLGKLKEGLSASLKFLEMGDPLVTYPTWSLPWRAVLCEALPCTVVPYVVGPSGVFKSSHIACLLAHHGHFRSKDDLPAHWESTDNALEKGSFIAKDVLYVIDDLNPETIKNRREDYEKRFSRIIRSVGNVTGRRRLNSDLHTRLEYTPRGLVMATGEYMPHLPSSTLARLFPIPYEEGSIDKTKLGDIQQHLDALPVTMRGYIEYLQSDFEIWRQDLQKRFQRLRQNAADLTTYHSRLPENVAHLALGLEMALEYARQMGILDEAEVQKHFEMGWTAFLTLAHQHGRVLREENPVQIFIQTLKEGLASGKAYLLHRTKAHLISGQDGPGKELLGWVDDQGIYLLPTVTFLFVMKNCASREGLGITAFSLHKMLANQGKLIRSQGEKDRYTYNVRVNGKLQRVIKLRPKTLGDLPAPLPPAMR